MAVMQNNILAKQDWTSRRKRQFQYQSSGDLGALKRRIKVIEMEHYPQSQTNYGRCFMGSRAEYGMQKRT